MLFEFRQKVYTFLKCLCPVRAISSSYTTPFSNCISSVCKRGFLFILVPPEETDNFFTLKKFLRFPIYWKMELSSSKIKTFLIFSQKNAFLIFRKRKSRKNSLYFWERNFLIFQETETLKNFLYFRK